METFLLFDVASWSIYKTKASLSFFPNYVTIGCVHPLDVEAG